MDTLKEKIVIGVEKPEGRRIVEELQRIIFGMRSGKLEHNNVIKVVNKNTENDVFEQVKKYKELLDMGIITEEEFNKKKKELLNL